jgi:hypothetical protein
MEQLLATISPATNQAASTATNLTAPLGRAGAVRRRPGLGRLIVPGPTCLDLPGPFVSSPHRVPEPHDARLHGDLPLEESAAIALRLEALGVPFHEHLVSAALPAASPEHVALVDDRGILPARGGEVAPREVADR